MIIIQLTKEELHAKISESVREATKEALNQTQGNEETQFISRKQVARLTDMSVRSVDEYTQQGKYIAYRLGHTIRYKRTEVIAAWQIIKHAI